MKTQTTASQQPVTLPDQTDRETVLISSLHNAMIGQDVAVSQAEIANFFISLKSKPLAILAGPAQSGKTALVKGLARALSGQNNLRFQMIAGHPWHAREWGDAAHYTSLHTRFSIETLRARLNIVFADQFRRSTAFVSGLSVQD